MTARPGTAEFEENDGGYDSSFLLRSGWGEEPVMSTDAVVMPIVTIGVLWGGRVVALLEPRGHPDERAS
ncbi:methionine/alanine import family NSS transporter small subunit [Streptomyces radicis]|uniref:Methionine/alanine import family NSS transporter small subunit n=1 Tax=Streptomyces radicis TaxID=1750517 RepID=A0A3A9X0F4_9ACTN|nr:methionine/alanine import family NSS transporter small subunit [Streptomyces radicis]RKN11927.1 methionine/alanine import family NSS transporter small subunit [Streptomyces radicis]RKN26022.1 methionine/alanine import family NSS transporter small subunit [Streptomyces radicis]